MMVTMVADLFPIDLAPSRPEAREHRRGEYDEVLAAGGCTTADVVYAGSSTTANLFDEVLAACGCTPADVIGEVLAAGDFTTADMGDEVLVDSGCTTVDMINEVITCLI